jgi:hydrogenase expression/formation protein HypC
MCIGIPMQLSARDGDLGTVEQGGLTHQVSLALLEEARVGDYVLVHAGFAISRLDPEEAYETLELLRQVGLVTPPAEEEPT